MPRPWRPVLASATKCCSAEDAVVAAGTGNGLARYRPARSEFSLCLASFRRFSFMTNSPDTPTDGKDDEVAGEMGVDGLSGGGRRAAAAGGGGGRWRPAGKYVGGGGSTGWGTWLREAMFGLIFFLFRIDKLRGGV